MQFTLPDNQALRLLFAGKDDIGVTAPVENVTFTFSDPELLQADAQGRIVVNPDAAKARTLPVVVQATPKADAEIGEGEDIIDGDVFEVLVTAGKAKTFGPVSATLEAR